MLPPCFANAVDSALLSTSVMHPAESEQQTLNIDSLLEKQMFVDICAKNCLIEVQKQKRGNVVFTVASRLLRALSNSLQITYKMLMHSP